MGKNKNVDQLVEELETINKRSFQMSFSVHKDSGLCSELAGEASLLEKRLLDIANELKQVAPAEHKQWFHRISESLLDLDFVITETDVTSFRLGDIIRWG